MGLLKTEPEGIVESMPELMAIAKAMEDEAACRYRPLARRMHNLGNKAAEDVFVHLAHEEETHAAERRILATCRRLAPGVEREHDQATDQVLARICEESRRNLQAIGLIIADLSAIGSLEDLPPVTALDRAIIATEAAAETYLQAGESAANEAAVLVAQQLSRSAITRLVALRDRRAELAPIHLEREP